MAQLFSQAGGKLRYDDALGAFVPDSCRQAVEVAGSAAGALDLPSVLAQGVDAASRALTAEGYAPEAPRLPPPTRPRSRTHRPCTCTPSPTTSDDPFLRRPPA